MSCPLRVGVLVVASVIAASVAEAGPTPTAPKQCGASVSVKSRDPLHVVGKVTAIRANATEPNRFEVVIADAHGKAKAEQRFELYLAPAKVPFAVGETIEVSIRAGGGWHRVFDGSIADANGKVLLVASGSGADDWADGWKVTKGKVVESRQDPNQKQRSINRTHALVFTRGKVKATVLPQRCVVVEEGGARYLVSGFGNTWLGIRPPEGVDYQTFAMIRW